MWIGTASRSSSPLIVLFYPPRGTSWSLTHQNDPWYHSIRRRYSTCVHCRWSRVPPTIRHFPWHLSPHPSVTTWPPLWRGVDSGGGTVCSYTEANLMSTPIQFVLA
jgi:hypothetical protein